MSALTVGQDVTTRDLMWVDRRTGRRPVGRVVEIDEESDLIGVRWDETGRIGYMLASDLVEVAS